MSGSKCGHSTGRCMEKTYPNISLKLVCKILTVEFVISV